MVAASRVLGVANQLDEGKAGAVAGFGITAPLAGVLNMWLDGGDIRSS